MNGFGNAGRARVLLELVDFASRSSGRGRPGEFLQMERHAANDAFDGVYCDAVYVATFDAGEFGD